MMGPPTDLGLSVARVLRRMAAEAEKTPSSALGRQARIVAGLTPETLGDRSRRQMGLLFQKAELDSKAYYEVDATLRLALRANHEWQWFQSLLSAADRLQGASFARALSVEDRLAMLADLAEKLQPLSLKAHLKPAQLLKKASELGYVIGLAGSIRELYGRNLRKIRFAALEHLALIDAARRQRPRLEVVDSRILGAVELPTRVRKHERSLALGSDRVVATGLRQPQVVRDLDEAGKEFEVVVTGVLEGLNIVAEVKGRTTAPGALDQFVKLNQRGSGGYVVIGDSLWLMPRFDPRKAKFFAVAPVGEFLQQAERQAEALTRLGYTIDVLAIDAAVDQEIYAIARELVADYVTLARSLTY